MLFLHADNDTLIDVQHSQQLHQMRLDLELPSEIFIQKSFPSLKKDHNNFIYEEDVLTPLTLFLSKHVPRGLVITLPEKAINEVSKTPELFKETIEKESDCMDNTLWCLCPYVALTECCISTCYLSGVFLGSHAGILRRDFRYVSRMERGKDPFPVELFSPNHNRRTPARTVSDTEIVIDEIVENPMAPSPNPSQVYEIDLVPVARRRLAEEKKHDSLTVRTQMEDFPVRQKSNSKADEL